MRSQRPNEPVSETPPRAVSALRARRGTGLRLGAILPMLALAAWLVSPQPGFLVAAFLLPALLAISVDRGGREIRSGIDALTGLEDRAGLVEALAAELGRAPYSGGDVAVLTLEIDRYKAFEQRLDRSALDHLLRQTARRLVANLRDSDVSARLDGPTFAVVVTSRTRFADAEIDRLARRLQDMMLRPIQNGDTPLQPTVSVGYAIAGAGPLPTARAFLQQATLALIEGQRAGTLQIRPYDAALHTRIAKRDEMARRAAAALESGEFRPWFQPQIDLATGRVIGMEALARWQAPGRPMVPPAEFLPVLQEAGLMPQLGRVMLTEALRALKSWDAAGFDVPQVGVNFSTEELERPDLLDQISFTLDRFGLAPERLSIEILETVVANTGGSVVVDNLCALSKLGCRLDLDDFGTGYASITTIRRVPVERLKIDRSFVTAIDSDPEQRQMVGAILTMAEKLGLRSLAEGVETEAERHTLQRLGCDAVQGFGIGKPMPPEAADRWLRDRRSDAPGTPAAAPGGPQAPAGQDALAENRTPRAGRTG